MVGDAAERELSAAESIALIEDQQRTVGTQLEPDSRLLYAVWGVTLAVGWGLLHLGVSDAAPFQVPNLAAGVGFAALMVAAVGVTAVHTSRRVAGVRGLSNRQGAMYGVTWAVGFGALTLIMGGAERAGLPDDLIALLWGCGAALVIGLLYMAAGALWQDALQYGLGIWVLVVAAAAAASGPSYVYAVLAVGIGAGFAIACAVSTVRMAREPRARS